MTSAEDTRRARLVNKRNVSGFSALSYAAWGGSDATVRLLLQSGADPLAINEQVFDPFLPLPLGSTPLHVAASRGQVAAATALLEHYALRRVNTPRGARPPPDPRNALNVHGHTPAAVAAQHGCPRLAQLLMPGVPVGRVVDVQELLRERGPPPLQELASQAWRAHLIAGLDAVAVEAAVAAGDACRLRRSVDSSDAHPGLGVAARGSSRCSSSSSSSSADEQQSAAEAGFWSTEHRTSCGSGAESAGLSVSRSHAPISGDSLDSAWCGETAGDASYAASSSPRCGACMAHGGGSPACCSPACTAGCALRQDSLQSSVDLDITFEVESDSDDGLDDVHGCEQQQQQHLHAAHAHEPHAHSTAREIAACSGSEASEDAFCGVCYEQPAAMLVLKACGHRLCADCVRGVVECPAAVGPVAPTCPFCRGTIAAFELCP